GSLRKRVHPHAHNENSKKTHQQITPQQPFPDVTSRRGMKRWCSKSQVLMIVMLSPIVVTLLISLGVRSLERPLISSLNGGALSAVHNFRCRMSSEWLPEGVLSIFNSSLAQIERALLDLNSTLSVGGDRPGLQFSGRPHRMKKLLPVSMIPGVVSGGLELWRGKECAAPFFRERVWGSTSMIQFMVTQPMCWIQHMSLAEDGSDPEGIKVRPAQGLSAADFLFPGYWVWAPIIENLADLGYDPASMGMAAYDWRLPLMMIEDRDHSFTEWQHQIELRKRLTGEKTVLISHSYGAQVAFFFIQWAESRGGVGWVDAHISSWVNIGGPLLGATKAVGTYMSGEMRDTAQLHPLIALALDKLVPPSARLSMLRGWGSGVAMFPKGGDQIWGSQAAGCPDDEFPADKTHTSGGVMHLRTVDGEGRNVSRALSATEALNVLRDISGPTFSRVIDELHSWEVDPDAASFPERWAHAPRKWTNVLETPLPYAPSMKVYCMYGVGKPTERAFHYTNSSAAYGEPVMLPDGRMGPRIPYQLDISVNNKDVNLVSGVQEADGDGTVPLLSMGYMCHEGWRRYSGLNPARMATIVREYPHAPASLVVNPRGVPTTGDHVDIMGNYELISDILTIVSGGVVQDRVLSRLQEYASRIQLKSTVSIAKMD
ncbi:MAG: hypothetical protein Q8N51_18480, partial [Gammaproteobacteria bacterium]|nr:hypothetical protein [Gammaproteobacteria bacterium]